MTTLNALLEDAFEEHDYIPPQTPPTLKRCPYDARIVAHENEMRILAQVNAYGHLRRGDLARLVWPDSPPKSAQKMCSRTVSRLLKAGDLLERVNTLGTRSLVVSSAGADRLDVYGFEAESGKDLSNVTGQQFLHRALGNSYLIERQLHGALEVYGEHAFYKGRAPITRERLATLYSKFPDGLVVAPANELGDYRDDLQAVDWIEVEGAHKSDTDYERLINIARCCGTLLDAKAARPLILARLVFVYPVGTNEVSILNYLRKTLVKENTPDARDALSCIRMVRVATHPGMIWKGQEEKTAFELLGL